MQPWLMAYSGCSNFFSCLLTAAFNSLFLESSEPWFLQASSSVSSRSGRRSGSSKPLVFAGVLFSEFEVGKRLCIVQAPVFFRLDLFIQYLLLCDFLAGVLIRIRTNRDHPEKHEVIQDEAQRKAGNDVHENYPKLNGPIHGGQFVLSR